MRVPLHDSFYAEADFVARLRARARGADAERARAPGHGAGRVVFDGVVELCGVLLGGRTRLRARARPTPDELTKSGIKALPPGEDAAPRAAAESGAPSAGAAELVVDAAAAARLAGIGSPTRAREAEPTPRADAADAAASSAPPAAPPAAASSAPPAFASSAPPAAPPASASSAPPAAAPPRAARSRRAATSCPRPR